MAIAAASLALFFSIGNPYFASTVINSDGSSNLDNVRRIAILSQTGVSGQPDAFRYVKLEDISVNSKEWFLNPFGKTMDSFYQQHLNSTLSNDKKERDAFLSDAETQEYYILVRLPDWLGGRQNDASVLRAYSAIDLESHCRISYWPNQDRQDIEDPCHSNHYRPWDGLTYIGISSFGISGGAISSTSDHLALPQIRLGIDKEGYVVAYKPDNQLYGDGVVGEGRRLTDDMLRKSNDELIRKTIGSTIYLPSEILPGYHLTWLSPTANYAASFQAIDFNGQASVLATYRQSGSRLLYDYGIAIVPLNNGSDLALSNYDFNKTASNWDIASRAEVIFNETVGQFNCFPSQTCTYESKSGVYLNAVDNGNKTSYFIAKIQKVFDPSRDEPDRHRSTGRALIWEHQRNNDGKVNDYLVSVDSQYRRNYSAN